MATAPEKLRSAAREPPVPIVAVTYCGLCVGRRFIWCDGCCGFGGCDVCGWTEKRPCPVCVGGDAELIRW